MHISKKHRAQICELDLYLKKNGVQHFSGREVLTLARAKIIAPVPPKKMWQNILPALEIAELIRLKMKMPLNVGNGYRPKLINEFVGGSKNSRHIRFQALDLDLLPKRATRKQQERFYKVSAEMFLDFGSVYQMGFGIYRPEKGTRIHIDCGWKRRFWGGPRKKWVRDLLRENR